MEAAFWGIDMAMEDKDQQAQTLAANPWVQLLWGPVASAVMFGIIAGLAGAWRDAPLTASDVTSLKTDVAALETKLAAVERSQVALEGEQRSNAQAIAQLREAINDIKGYNGQTMKEMKELSLQFAEIKGSIKEKKNK